MKSWAVCTRCSTAYPKSANNCPRHDREFVLWRQRWTPYHDDPYREAVVVVRIPPSSPASTASNGTPRPPAAPRAQAPSETLG